MLGMRREGRDRVRRTSQEWAELRMHGGCKTSRAAPTKDESPSQSGFPLVALASLTFNPEETLRVPTGRVRLSPAGKPARRLTTKTKDEIVRLYRDEGLDSLEVSRLVDVAKSTVLRILRDRDVVIRPAHRGYRRD